ncbi:hypothetical protein D3C85_1318470 [compost metagenome]
MQQHATGTGLADQGRRNIQPVRRTFYRHLQDGGMGFTHQVAIACAIAAQAFEVQFATAHE